MKFHGTLSAKIAVIRVMLRAMLLALIYGHTNSPTYNLTPQTVYTLREYKHFALNA